MKHEQLIWVSNELAEKYKELEGTEAQEKLVMDVIDRKRRDFTTEVENLNDAALIFKAVCLTHKNELEKIYQEQEDKLYKLWQGMGDIGSKVKDHAKALAAEVSPLRKEVNDLTSDIDKLKKTLDGLHIYDAERLVQLIEKITYLDSGTKNILEFLISNYKK